MRGAWIVYRWLVRAALLAAAAVLCLNAAGRRALEREALVARDPSTGIMTGAEPVRIDRGRPRACLLLHGWISAPADFGGLPRALDAAGWDVYAPLHPGHGTTPRDLADVTADDLLERARSAYAHLGARYERVALVGFSMGGTIAAALAAERAPDGLVLVAPFYGVAHKWYYVLPARWWHELLSPVVRYVPRGRRLVRVNRPEGRKEVLAYGVFPASAARALFQLRDRALAEARPDGLRMPVLVVYSTGDEVASPAATRGFVEALPSAEVRVLVLERSNHHILHDYDREEAISATVAFLGGL